METGIKVALVVAACLAGMQVYAQAQSARGASSPSHNQPGQTQPASAPNNPKPPAAESKSSGNPFPGNTTSVPILPSGPTSNVPEGAYAPGNDRSALPDEDQDPLRSPDTTTPDSGQVQGFSSSLSGLDDVLPPPDDTQAGKKKQQAMGLPKETPENDVSVGDYYLSTKNWRAALSRFQSAMVLEPENPDVYWGLAESERHLDDYALAREHYLKVLEYDPGSKHAKEARKALRNPEIANAKPSTTSQTGSK